MQMLAAKLADRQREEREAEMNALAGEQRDVGWGSQIRSYVLAPYQQVKDLRSGHEVGNPDNVLDGSLPLPIDITAVLWPTAWRAPAPGSSRKNP